MSGNDRTSGNDKSAWEKADILMKPVGALLTALVVTWLGIQGRAIIEARQIAESKSQLYAQLMSAREQSDSSLRQSMFQTIIDEFLVTPAIGENELRSAEEGVLERYEREVLKLEVLAYNFHDALDLAPLFKDVYRRLSRSEGAEAGGVSKEQVGELTERLESIAADVNDKQIAALDSGFVVRKPIVLAEFDVFYPKLIQTAWKPQAPVDEHRKLNGKAFSVDVLGIDHDKKEVYVRLTVWPLDSDGTAVIPAIVDVNFSVGFFDFPMIDNTRLSDGERCAIVLTAFDTETAEMALVYFPGARASLKEKPFYDEIIDDLLDTPGSS